MEVKRVMSSPVVITDRCCNSGLEGYVFSPFCPFLTRNKI